MRRFLGVRLGVLFFLKAEKVAQISLLAGVCDRAHPTIQREGRIRRGSAFPFASSVRRAIPHPFL